MTGILPLPDSPPVTQTPVTQLPVLPVHAVSQDPRLFRANVLVRPLPAVSDITAEVQKQVVGWTSTRARDKGDLEKLLVIEAGEWVVLPWHDWLFSIAAGRETCSCSLHGYEGISTNMPRDRISVIYCKLAKWLYLTGCM
jgi:hypothetical protein